VTRPCGRCLDCRQGRDCAFSTQITGAVLGEVIGLVIAMTVVLASLALTH
jgi:hypothetical protein